MSEKNTRSHDICVLLPTRGRTQALYTSITSLTQTARNPQRLQFLVGFDSDDTVGKSYFQDHMISLLDSQGIAYTALEFEPMGYVNLEKYYNGLARHSDSDWLFVWNDDAIMETPNWDQVILSYSGQFRLLRVRTHLQHPYSIFPIWPRAWYDLFGHVSRHQMVDAEISQMAYCLDLMTNIDVEVTHDRADLTGNNNDATQRAKVSLEGNPQDPRDFHNRAVSVQRYRDCQILADYLESQGHDISHWNEVKSNQRNPWEKLRANDPNGLTIQKNVSA